MQVTIISNSHFVSKFDELIKTRKWDLETNEALVQINKLTVSFDFGPSLHLPNITQNTVTGESIRIRILPGNPIEIEIKNIIPLSNEGLRFYLHPDKIEKKGKWNYTVTFPGNKNKLHLGFKP